MKNNALPLFAVTFVLLLAPATAPVAAEINQPQQPAPAEFTSAIDDLPLMPGLKTVEDKDVLFVEPQVGRIAETEATGEVSIDDVYDFYRHSLPHLGWKAIDGRTYQREGERLRINAESSGKTTTVQFAVQPISGK